MAAGVLHQENVIVGTFAPVKLRFGIIGQVVGKRHPDRMAFEFVELPQKGISQILGRSPFFGRFCRGVPVPRSFGGETEGRKNGAVFPADQKLNGTVSGRNGQKSQIGRLRFPVRLHRKHQWSGFTEQKSGVGRRLLSEGFGGVVQGGRMSFLKGEGRLCLGAGDGTEVSPSGQGGSAFIHQQADFPPINGKPLEYLGKPVNGNAVGNGRPL